jgi:hypothetical protein
MTKNKVRERYAQECAIVLLVHAKEGRSGEANPRRHYRLLEDQTEE